MLALYRLRWRVELAFKRLKSVIGLQRPPGTDARSARPYVLAHLLSILLLEPIIDELEELSPQGLSPQGCSPPGLSPLGLHRLTRPGVWRLLRQLRATATNPVALATMQRHPQTASA